MKNLNDLRAILFEQIESLKNNHHPENIARAKAINDLSQTIIGTAKVEIDYVRATDAEMDDSFIIGKSTKPTLEHKPQSQQSIGYGTIREKTGRKY